MLTACAGTRTSRDGARRLGARIARGILRERRQDARGAEEDLRLWVPYVVGDLYGGPNEGEFAPVALSRT
jgi:hypothetical protein